MSTQEDKDSNVTRVTVDYLIVHTVGLGKFSCTLGGMQEAHVTHGVTKVTNM